MCGCGVHVPARGQYDGGLYGFLIGHLLVCCTVTPEKALRCRRMVDLLVIDKREILTAALVNPAVPVIINADITGIFFIPQSSYTQLNDCSCSHSGDMIPLYSLEKSETGRESFFMILSFKQRPEQVHRKR
jgi:hypothetical protein